MHLFILYESAQGYVLFEKEEYDETGAGLSKVQKAVADLERFTKMVSMVAYQPFSTAEEALENIQAVASTKVSPLLSQFLTSKLPATKSSKKQKFALGISDPKLGQEIFGETGITASYNETTTELLRGIRMHFTKMIKSKFSLEFCHIPPLLFNCKIRAVYRIILTLQIKIRSYKSAETCPLNIFNKDLPSQMILSTKTKENFFLC